MQTQSTASDPTLLVLRIMKKTYDALASYYFAILLMTILSLVLAWASFAERAVGTPAIHDGVYGAGWFHGLQALIGLNVFLAMFRRRRWRMRQIGFLLTHAGLIILLLGCLITAKFGVEATLAIYEGHSRSMAVNADKQEIRLIVFEEGAEPDTNVSLAPFGPPEETDGATDSIEIPFLGGPFHWSEYEESPGVPPLRYSEEDEIQPTAFPWGWRRRSESVLYDDESSGIRVEVLDYLANARLEAPMTPISFRVLCIEDEEAMPPHGGAMPPVAPSGSSTPQWRNIRLRFNDMQGMGEMPHSFMSSVAETTLPDGTTMNFRVTEDEDESKAFLAALPKGDLGTWGQAVLVVDGTVFRLSMTRMLDQHTETRESLSQLEWQRSGLITSLEAADSSDDSLPEEKTSLREEIAQLDEEVDALNEGLRYPLGETPFTVELQEFYQSAPAIELTIRDGEESIGSLRLFAHAAVANSSLPDHGIYGAYWISATGIRDGAGDMTPPYLLDRLAERRIEFLQTPDKKLVWRTWDGDAVDQFGPYATTATHRELFAETDSPATVSLTSFEPLDRASFEPSPIPFQKPAKGMPLARPCVKLRVAVDGIDREFWISKRITPRIPMLPEDADQFVIRSRDRRIVVQWMDVAVDLGFQLYLRKFQQKLDPGSSMPAGYSSQVDLRNLDGELEDENDADLTIRLNRPPTFRDSVTGRPYRVYQSSFSGPETPGSPIYDFLSGSRLLEGETAPRDELYQSVFTANYDPGRGPKYLGCLLCVVGTFVLLFRRKRNSQSQEKKVKAGESESGSKQKGTGKGAKQPSLTILLLAVILVCGAAACVGGPSAYAGDDLEQEGWDAWRSMPVFHGGRLMPLNTYAKLTVERIVGESEPYLVVPEKDRRRMSSGIERRVEQLIPEEGRHFSDVELIFSWMVEPEAWAEIPFLPAADADLRSEVLQLSRDSGISSGGGLEYVSPNQVQMSEKFWTHLNEMRMRPSSDDEDPDETKKRERIAKATTELYNAMNAFYEFSHSPLGENASQFIGSLNQAYQTQTEINNSWNMVVRQTASAPAVRERLMPRDVAYELTPQGRMEQLRIGLNDLRLLYMPQGHGQTPEGEPEEDKPEPVFFETDIELCRLHEIATLLAGQFLDARTAAYDREASAELSEEGLTQIRSELHSLTHSTRTLAQQIDRALLSIYENRNSLHVVPALNPAALTSNRTPSDDTQPWLGLGTLVLGSDETVRRFARPDLSESMDSSTPRPLYGATLMEYLDDIAGGNPERKIQIAFSEAAEAYIEMTEADADERESGAAQQFRDAMTSLAGEISMLGNEIESHRLVLEIPNRDERLLELTAYPTSLGRIRAEITYYDLNPFFWTFVLCGIAFLLLLTQLVLDTRTKIISVFFWGGIMLMAVSLIFATIGFALRAYVTGWAPLTNMFETIVFTVWIALLLGLWYALKPITGRGVDAAWSLTRIRVERSSSEVGPNFQTGMLTVRTILTLVGTLMALFLCYAPDSEATGLIGVLKSVPGLLTLNGLIDAMVVISLLAFLSWWGVRILFVLGISFVTIPRSLRRDGPEPVTPFYVTVALGTAFIGTMGVFFAVYGKDFDSNIKPLMAVLRDNFWLTFHVSTIAIGYAAGALSWVFGFVILMLYLLRPYKKIELASGKTPKRWPLAQPDWTDKLEEIVLVTTKIAALFIMVGTITGARWADFSWGRFWSWDPKEIWALITLCCYLVILHAYRARYIRRFGLCVGAVLSAIAIAMTFYGINYVFGSGRHSYGSGETTVGAIFLGLFILLNIGAPLIAGARYVVEQANATEGPEGPRDKGDPFVPKA
jgi:ABC-type transport system involved in cytochrome c biogenesis permease subunit